jgi:type IV secretion system protein VirB6
MSPKLSKFTVLTNSYAYLSSALGDVTNSYSNGLLPIAVSVIAAAGTLYFVLLGFMVMRGIIASPLSELGMSALKFGLVVALLGSTGFTGTVISTANRLPAALISAGGGTAISNPGQSMDNYFGNAMKLLPIIQQKWDKDKANMIGSSSAASIVGAVGGSGAASTTAAIMDPSQTMDLFVEEVIESIFLAIVFVIAGFSACVGFVIYIFALFALDVVLALTPIAIAATLFSQTRWIFQGWISQLMNYVLLMVVVAIIIGMITGLNTSIMADLTGGSISASTLGGAVGVDSTGAAVAFGSTGEVIVACCSIAIVYILGTLFFFQAPAIASGIVGGSPSGGHNFLAVGANQILGRMNRVRMPRGPSGRRSAGGGSISRG